MHPEISDDPRRLDVDLVHRWLSEDAYWALGYWALDRPREVVEASLAGSVVLGAYEDGAQVALARVVTDGATHAWLCDVDVAPSHRGRGLGHRLVEAALGHPRVAGCRRVLLATADAHGLYASHGFTDVEPGRSMQLLRGG